MRWRKVKMYLEHLELWKQIKDRTVLRRSSNIYDYKGTNTYWEDYEKRLHKIEGIDCEEEDYWSHVEYLREHSNE
jgi:hypothetical protein